MSFLRKKLRKKQKPKVIRVKPPAKVTPNCSKPRTSPPVIQNRPQNKNEKPDRPVNYEKEFSRVLKTLSYRHRTDTIWKDFITMFACSISNAVDKAHYHEREKLYFKTIEKYSKEELEMFPTLCAYLVEIMEQNPEQDFLGHMYMKLNLYSDTHGQIFTPYHISNFMAKITIGEDIAAQIKEKEFISINDPTCGSSVMLIAVINESRKQLSEAGLNFQNHILITGQDIDYIAALMCYIQISLLGAAGYIKIGNSLTEPMVENDSTENYWYTPMYFSGIWKTRRLFKSFDALLKGEENGLS